MSRQSKNRRKAKLAKQMSALRRERRAQLTPKQRALRREQARILAEAKITEAARLRLEREARARREKERQERMLTEALIRKEQKKRGRKLLQNSSKTLVVPKQEEVTPHGTVLHLKATGQWTGGATVISRKGIHIKTYPAGALVRFLGDGRHAVVVMKDQPPRLLDLETGLDREIEQSVDLNLNGG